MEFLFAKHFAKNASSLCNAGRNVGQLLYSWIIPFFIIKRYRTYTWHAISSNKKYALNIQTSWIFSTWKHLIIGSTNICPMQNIPAKMSSICIFEVLCFVWSTYYWERIIDIKWTSSSRNKTRANSRWYIYYTVRLQGASVDVNHIHKGRYSVQLSAVPIYIFWKKAHKTSNSALLLYLEVEKHSSPSLCLWIMKFRIDYLVFIISMRKNNFFFFFSLV